MSSSRNGSAVADRALDGTNAIDGAPSGPSLRRNIVVNVPRMAAFLPIVPTAARGGWENECATRKPRRGSDARNSATDANAANVDVGNVDDIIRVLLVVVVIVHDGMMGIVVLSRPDLWWVPLVLSFASVVVADACRVRGIVKGGGPSSRGVLIPVFLFA